jgi:O-antigen/teichoic acid export membrane protein
MSAEPQFAWRVTEATSKEPLTGVREAGAGLSLTPARLRVWGMRSGFALLDQGLTSGAGFGVNLLLARWMPAEVYGAFVLAFAGFLFISGFYNVLLLDPMSVMGPSRHAERLPAYFRVQIAIHAVLVGALSVGTLLTSLVLWRIAPGSLLTRAIVGAGLALPFLLLLWLARRMCYVVQRPSIAVAGSSFYLAFIVGGLTLLGHYERLGAFTAFALMGIGSILASALLVWRLRLLECEAVTKAPISWQVALRENWTYGRWLMLTTSLSWTTFQAQTFLAASFLGLASAGALRAIQLPSLAMTQVISATALLVLPSMSQELGNGNVARLRKKAIITTVCLTALGIVFVAGLFLFAAPLEKLLFGGKYASSAWLIPVLGLVPVFTGFSVSLCLALRVLLKSHLELIACAFSAATALALAILLMPRWGLIGAAASIVGSTAVLAIAVLICFLKWGNE